MARYLKWLTYVLLPGLFLGALWAIERELHQFHWREIVAASNAAGLALERPPS